MPKKTNNIFSSQYPSGIVFVVGAILIGIGLGLVLHKTGAFTLIGIGVGFVLSGLISMLTRNKFLDR